MGDESLPEGEVEKKRVVNYLYVYYVTTVLLGLIVYLTAFRSGPIAVSGVDGSFSLLTVIVFTFLGVNTLDKSNILSKIGDGVRNNSTKITVLTPEEMRRISGAPAPEVATTTVNVNTPNVEVKSDG